MKVGTDGVLLGAAMTLFPSDHYLLDVGTGTGLIALMAAQRCPGAQIFAIDIDAPSAEEANYNFSNSPFAPRLNASCTPLSAYKAEHKFDLIFSNPPYYDSSLLNPDAREARARHTETLSFRHLCAFAAENLNPNGRLSLVLPATVERELRLTAASFGLSLFRILRIRTTPSKPYSRIIAEFCLSASSKVADGVGSGRPNRGESNSKVGGCSEEELTLNAKGGAKTPEYQALTADFYL